MWTRKELKEKAKAAVKRNYWKAVLVAVVLILIGEGLVPAAAAGGSSSDYDEEEGYEVTVGNIGLDDGTDEILNELEEIDESAAESFRGALDELEQMDDSLVESFAVVLFAAIMTIAIVIMLVVVIFRIFIGNPLRVGARRFMLNSIDDKGNIADLGYAFDHNYMNTVKTMFVRMMRVFLWSLLFIIPGIYKSYQYCLVDYILAENPDMPRKEVLELSKKMMDGQKWKAFVLDLSFIPWHMLNAVTCGLSGIFYVKPYMCLTEASLYRTLADEHRQ